MLAKNGQNIKKRGELEASEEKVERRSNYRNKCIVCSKEQARQKDKVRDQTQKRVKEES